jgi:putative transposase
MRYPVAKGSAQKLFNKAISNNGEPRVINIDKNGSNLSAIRSVNKESLSMKNINIIVEQDHRNIQWRISVTTGFKEFHSAQRTQSVIEFINLDRTIVHPILS